MLFLQCKQLHWSVYGLLYLTFQFILHFIKFAWFTLFITFFFVKYFLFCLLRLVLHILL